MATDNIVSIGLLTANDLRRLGNTFTRHIPVADDAMFADLLERLDAVEPVPQHACAETHHRG